MTRLIVEAGFGYTVAQAPNIGWTDISQYVDVVTGVSLGRGASDEISEIQPATCSMTLDDSDGRFTPGRATSPYWPNVRKNTPIRVSVAVLDTAPTGAGPFPLSQLADDFDDNQVNTVLWPDNFGGAVEVGGRARVPVAAGAVGSYGSVRQWTLTGSQTTVRLVTMASPGGGATTARTAFMVNAVTSGTRIGFVVDAVPGTIACRSDVGSADAAAVTLTYSPTTHAWLRVREAAGTVYWETSPNGYQWTVRRTLATPAWVGTDQVALQMSATRDAGPTDYVEYDLVGATVHSRFYGMVNEWPLRLKGLQATTTITCTDLFKWLSGKPSLGPMLSNEILTTTGVQAYYPLSEDASSVSAGDLAGKGATSLAVVQMGSGGTLAFAGSTGPAETGQSGPLFTPASASAGQYLRADLGPAVEAAGNNIPSWVEVWIQTSTAGRTFLAAETADLSWRVVFGLQTTTGLLQMRYSQDPTAPAAAWASDVVTGSGNLADGKLHHVVINLFSTDRWVDGVYVGPNTFGTSAPLRTLYLGGYADGLLWSGTIAHFALYSTSSNLATALTSHYAAGATGYAGEAGNLRIQRLAKYVNITSVTSVGTTFDPQASQGPGGSTGLAMMQSVATTESARLSANRDSFGLTLMSRDIRYNPVAGVSLSYPDLETDSVEHSDDDQKMVNSVVASRPGGATQRVISQASIDAYGPKEQQLDLLKTSDNSVLDAANWLISRYSDPPPELREIPIEAYTMGAATYRALLGLGISSVLTVTDLPDQAPAATQTVFVEGYTETIRQASHLLSFHTSRSYNDSAWVLDDPTYSTLGSTTKLAY